MNVRLRVIAFAYCATALVACNRTPDPALAPPAATKAAPSRAVDMLAELRAYDRDVIERLRRLPDNALGPEERAILARGTMLNAPAPQSALDALAAKFGKPLPASYRDFLAASNGMLFEGAFNAVTMFDAEGVVPLADVRYPGLAIWRAMPDAAIPLDPTAGGPLPGAALARAWMISSVEDGDVYLIFPDLAGADGEWPVWFFGPKNPGAIGYASFGAMLARERPQALNILELRIQRARAQGAR